MNQAEKTFDKDVIITIKGFQTVENDTQSVELLTLGKFSFEKGNYYISYDETETTGFEGSQTTLKFGTDQVVTMRRCGRANTQLVIAQGKRHQCCYDTGMGEFMVGINGKKVMSNLNEKGGILDFSYSMDINAALASENRVIINVKESTKEC